MEKEPLPHHFNNRTIIINQVDPLLLFQLTLHYHRNLILFYFRQSFIMTDIFAQKNSQEIDQILHFNV